MNTEGNKAAKKRQHGIVVQPKPRAPLKIGNPVKVFFCVATGEVEYYYARMGRDADRCTDGGLHGARKSLARMPEANTPKEWPPEDDPVWPTKCDQCGVELNEENSRRHSGAKHIYVRQDNGTEIIPSQVVGAVTENREYGPFGSDGRGLTVTIPGPHTWRIDSRAKNCKLPDDDVHRCWVRTGKPEDGTLHVGKHGNTCKAGAGSIDTGQWHGYLHHGELKDC